MHFENVIIGAGPAGVQLAYNFKKNNISYIILEKTKVCGSFFEKYPHTSKLISINKKHTGKQDKDFNLRHDWNSLLNEDDFLLKDYSDEFYPDHQDLHRYINDFANKYELNIQYNTDVKKINKIENKYEIITDTTITCDKLIVATGLSLPNNPTFTFKSTISDKINHYADFPKGYFKDIENLKKYANKKILLVGGGNSAYELANVLNNYASNIIIWGSKKDLSIVSHYAGDIRSIYLPFLDTFYLKSMNGIDKLIKTETGNSQISVVQNSISGDKNYGKYQVFMGVNTMYFKTTDLEYYDEIIYCTGFKFDASIFSFDLTLCINNKFPQINHKYESSNNPNLYFIGSLMHSIDYKKSSGGFIHGFRYLIKLFTQLNYQVPFDMHKFKFDGTLNCYTKLADHIYHRINTSSSLYQMYGVLNDLFYFDKVNKEIIYYESITKECVLQLNLKMEKYNLLNLTYGDKVYDITKLGNFDKYNPSFLHPEILLFQNSNLIDKIIFEEDLVADFKNKSFYDKIQRTLKGCNLVF